MYRTLRALLFAFDAEHIHHTIMRLTKLALGLKPLRSLSFAALDVRDPALEQTLWGVRFKNPVGLAAGFDKDARYIHELEALGFGAIEIGTITGQQQPGNPTPRLFRLPQDQALLNRMGFNNGGAPQARARLSALGARQAALGVNIGKSKVVALEDAAADYLLSLTLLFEFADYLVVNVSSPNTPGLRQLQEKAPLSALLATLKARAAELAAEQGCAPKPLLLKIAPDLSDAQLDDVLEVVRQVGVDGLIATNTTISRQGLQTAQVEALGAGGISGQPVRARALEVVSYLYRETRGQVPIIGVGGIFTGEDAVAMLEAGASAVQVWTGFVYEGPTMVRRINAHILHTLKARGLTHVSQLTGAAHQHKTV